MKLLAVQTHVRRPDFVLKQVMLLLLLGALVCFQLTGFCRIIPPVNTISTYSFHPPITVRGKITAANGQDMPGVSVSLKGSKISVASDEKGNYSISIPDDKGVLVFTFIGYIKKEIDVNSRSTLNVELEPQNNSLDEAVVVGYGTQRKRELTGSIATLKSTEIEKQIVTSFQTAMQGQLAGVEMYESSGVPGAAIQVRIRGLNTINGSASPLYIVDGIPVFSGGGGDGESSIVPSDPDQQSGSQSNPLADINPNDIESIEVLKDAASTAIYGARASGGVVLITTKRGKSGKTSYSLKVSTGASRVSKEKALLNSPQLLDVMDEAYRNSFYSIAANAGLPIPATPLPAIIGLDRVRADTTNISHLGNILQTAPYHEVSLSAMNGSDKTRFYVNGTFKRTIATMKGSDFNQFNFLANIDHDFNNSISFGVSIAPSYNKNNLLGSGDVSTAGGFGAATTTQLPFYPLYNEDGTYFNPWFNPAAFQDRDVYANTVSKVRIRASAYFTAKILPGLNYRINASRENYSQINRSYISGLIRQRSVNNTEAAGGSAFTNDELARAGQNEILASSNLFENYLNYKKTIGKIHTGDMILGMRYQSNDQSEEALYGEGFANNNLLFPSEAALVEPNSALTKLSDKSVNIGYFFRFNYQLLNRYLLGFTVNRDGNSRFGGDNKFGTFPAVSGGWIISDEKFMNKNSFISFLKIRASGGLTGNAQGIDNNAEKSTWANSSSAYGALPAVIPNKAANANLQWERGVKYDAGIDFGFLNNRINGTIDYFHNITRQMLLSIPAPFTFGYTVSDYLENRGSLESKGIEFGISANILTRAFKWRANFNITHHRTNILSLGGLDPESVSGGEGSVQLYEGQQGPVFYLVEWIGVDPATGGELVRDQKGNTVLASSLSPQQLSDARKPQYDKLPTPKFYGGFTNTFSYKGFDLSFLFTYRYGNYLLDVGERTRSYVANLNYINKGSQISVGNLPVTLLDRWTTLGQVTDVPKVFYNDATNDVLRTRNSSRFLYDASYLRLKNILLSYTLPGKLVKRAGIKSARLNLTGQNLLLFTRFPGDDPEAINTSGATYRERNIAYGMIRNQLPLAKALVFGINVDF